MRKTLAIVFALLLAFPLQVAVGQEVSLARQASQESVEVILSQSGEVFVRHVVDKSSAPVQVELMSGTKDGIRVTGPDGGETGFAMVNGEQGVLFLPSEEDRVVEYELTDRLVREENGLWILDFYYPESTIFYFPENIEMIFVDNKPVMLDEKKAIRCHGCQMVLHYFEDGRVQIERVVWGDHRFDVQIISLAEAGSFEFDQPAKTISYQVPAEDEFVVIVLPFELLWEPYEVYLDDEKILFHSYIKNDTHAWLTMRPEAAGTVSIIGTTAVPEFSMFLPLVLGVSLIVLLQYRNRFTPR